MGKFATTAGLLKSLADEKRLRIINLLAGVDELCVCDLTEQLALSQPNMSHHLKLLKEAGLITAAKRGRWVYYSLNHEELAKVTEELQSIISSDGSETDFKKSDCQ
ncbi:MAG: ArsR/SmtB family transcription factor [Bacillota bacterium]